MEKRKILRQTVADLAEVNASTVSGDFSLSVKRLQTSIGRAALDAAIRRRLGVACPAAYTAKTFAELEAAIGVSGRGAGDHEGNGAASLATAAVERAGAFPEVGPQSGSSLGAQVDGTIRCGIDIELVEELPPAEDFWEHAFYRNNFSKTEIAYCVLQPDPLQHFAARWCSKEALKKCDGEFLGRPMSQIELVNDSNGKPWLQIVGGETGDALPFAVSVSHTSTMAIAVVIKHRTPENGFGPPKAPLPPKPPLPPEPPRQGAAVMHWAVTAVALLIAALALARTLL